MSATIAYYGGIVTDGLVLYMDAAKRDSYPGFGTNWNSVARGGLVTGSLINGPTFSYNNGGSIQFDGTNDYVDIGNSLNITGNLTYNAWIRTSGDFRHLIGAYSSTFPFAGWGVAIGISGGGGTVAAGNLGFWSASPGSGWKDSGIKCNTNSWINVCVVLNSTTVSFYSNGVFSTSTSASLISSYTEKKTIGARSDGTITYIGDMSLTHIYNRALSASEVLQNYNATKGRFGL